MYLGLRKADPLLKLFFLNLNIPTVWECDTAMYFDPEGPDCPQIAEFREWAEREGIRRDISADDPEFRAVKMFSFANEETVRRLIGGTAETGMPYTAKSEASSTYSTPSASSMVSLRP